MIFVSVGDMNSVDIFGSGTGICCSFFLLDLCFWLTNLQLSSFLTDFGIFTNRLAPVVVSFQ